jgi:hypothetical protein
VGGVHEEALRHKNELAQPVVVRSFIPFCSWFVDVAARALLAQLFVCVLLVRSTRLLFKLQTSILLPCTRNLGHCSS